MSTPLPNEPERPPDLDQCSDVRADVCSPPRILVPCMPDAGTGFFARGWVPAVCLPVPTVWRSRRLITACGHIAPTRRTERCGAVPGVRHHGAAEQRLRVGAPATRPSPAVDDVDATRYSARRGFLVSPHSRLGMCCASTSGRPDFSKTHPVTSKAIPNAAFQHALPWPLALATNTACRSSWESCSRRVGHADPRRAGCGWFVEPSRHLLHQTRCAHIVGQPPVHRGQQRPRTIRCSPVNHLRRGYHKLPPHLRARLPHACAGGKWIRPSADRRACSCSA